MFPVIVVCVALALFSSTALRRVRHRNPPGSERVGWTGASAALGLLGAVALFAASAGTATAAGSDVTLATARNYAVLAGTTVTNTGPSTLNGSLGLSPGSDVTGFPPGLVVAPWTSDVANAAAQQAKSDLTAGYLIAAGRSVSATTTADLGGLHLQPGVYAGPSKGALGLTGTLVLDGAGNAASVFIFQTDSSLITASGSTVRLVNGALACHVYWQVGSSATLGSGSVFVGNILALTSITVETGVSVQGRALARNGGVTLDNDVFTRPSCARATPTATPGGGQSTLPPTGSADEGTLLAAIAVLLVGAGAAFIARRELPARRS